MKKTIVFSFGFLSFLLGLSNVAAAHNIVVDGFVSDWVGVAPAAHNLSTTTQGEYIWKDAISDARTDFANPEQNADLNIFSLTGDLSNLYIRAQFSSLATDVIGPTMMQIAIDNTFVAGDGVSWFAGFADTQVAGEAAWEHLIIAQSGALSASIIDSTFTQVGTGLLATSEATGNIEVAVPWSSLGLTAGDSIRLTTAIFRTDGFGNTLDIVGQSDALDAISNQAETWNEVSDGVIDFYEDIHFTQEGNVVPIPGTVWLFGAGLTSLFGFRFRKRAKE